MPTYDYVCTACGHRFEAFQGMTAKKLRKCPQCGKSALERQVGAGAGLIFKGSGFYVTDYKKSGGESGAAKPEAGAGGDAKPEKAPATGAAEDKGAAAKSPAAPPSPPAAQPKTTSATGKTSTKRGGKSPA
jgi:putative FmdB family regulatory protein